jgi:hypothetical protein
MTVQYDHLRLTVYVLIKARLSESHSSHFSWTVLIYNGMVRCLPMPVSS